jgi:hypothetical protein
MGKIFGEAGRLAGIRTIKEMRVPKKDMIDAGLLLVQQGRVTIGPSRWKETLLTQLAHFKAFRTGAGRLKLEADSEEIHDDLVVCFCMGAWWIQNRKDRNIIPEQRAEKENAVGWEPADYM